MSDAIAIRGAFESSTVRASNDQLYDEKMISLRFREYMDSRDGIQAIGSATETLTLDDISSSISRVKAAERSRKEALRPKQLNCRQRRCFCWPMPLI